MRILVIGRGGQLAMSLVERAVHKAGIELITIGRPELDLEKPHTIAEQFKIHQPALVINAAAYTAVDKAELNQDLAFTVNRNGAAEAARAAYELDVPFVHISTDYVFDGRKATPYVELDKTDPINAYGRSKLEGERLVLAAHPWALVLRTSWVFSPFGSNFVKTMLKLAAERQMLHVVNDQFGNPTSSLDLATAILEIAPMLQRDPGGLYHLTGLGSTSWHEFATLIFRQSHKLGGSMPVLEAIGSDEYKTAARRPRNSRLDCKAFFDRFGISLRPWEVAASEVVARCLAE